MFRVAVGGILLGAALLLAVDYLFAKTTYTSEQLARMRLYDLWMKTGVVKVYVN
jgi:hypothetical protein